MNVQESEYKLCVKSCSNEQQPWRKVYDLCAVIIITLIATILYKNTINVPWYFDDFSSIVLNPLIRNLQQAFMSVFSHRGVAYLSFAMNYRFGGFDVSGFHIVNISIHIVTSIVVYFILKRIFPSSFVLTLGGALIFLCHPLQTQAVTYIVQRMTSLAGLFFFLSILLFIRARERLKMSSDFFSPVHLLFYISFMICGALAVFSKESTAILPLAMILFDRFFLDNSKGSWKRIIFYISPFFIISGLYAVFNLILPILRGTPIQIITAIFDPVNKDTVSSLTYLFTEFSVIWIYIKLLFFPYGQVFDYNYPYVTSLLNPKSMLALGGTVALFAIAFYFRRKKPLISFGIAWFFLTLAIESSFIPLDAIFEHRLYIPMFGFVIVLLDLIRMTLNKKYLVLFLTAILIVLSFLTWQRNFLWTDPVAFYEDNVFKSPHNTRIHAALAKRYADNGRLTEALATLEKAAHFPHKDIGTYINLSKVYGTLGRLDDAYATLKEGIQLYPNSDALYNNLGIVCYQKGDTDQAIACFQKALYLNPHYSEALYNYGTLYLHIGKLEAAEDCFRKVIDEMPTHANAHYNLGAVFARQGKILQARAELLTSIQIDPQNVDALYSAAILSLKIDDIETAQMILASLRRLDSRRALLVENVLNKDLKSSTKPEVGF